MYDIQYMNHPIVSVDVCQRTKVTRCYFYHTFIGKTTMMKTEGYQSPKSDYIMDCNRSDSRKVHCRYTRDTNNY